MGSSGQDNTEDRVLSRGRRCNLLFVCWAALCPAVAAVHADSLADRPPPGPHHRLTTEDHASCPSSRTGQPIVGTTYFYWYDVYTGEHMTNPDGTSALTRRPPADAMADLSYRSVGWHERQLLDVAAAGIDFIMPVYWGLPGEYEAWSAVGLRALVQAHERMTAARASDAAAPRPPAIGMFYDTSTLQHHGRDTKEAIDLTTDEGREWFYVTIRDFWSLIPPNQWARVDGRPIVFLYAASFAAAVDEELFTDLRARFQAEFGTDLFVVRHVDWPGKADAWYIWGGATGLRIGRHVAALGPGYDESAVQGRRPPLIVDRQRGAFYDRQWESLLRIAPVCRPWIVHVETWNEWHEGTDIARSHDANDLYMRATAKYADAFRAGVRLDPQGPFVNARQVTWSGRRVGGLHLRESGGDGRWHRTVVDDSPAVSSIEGARPEWGRYLYFDVDDSYLFGDVGLAAEVTVVFRDDGGCGRFWIEYDSSDPESGPLAGAFRSSPAVTVGQTGTWRSITRQLPDALLCNRCNGADLRLAIDGERRQLTVRELIVRRLPGRGINE